ncbi:hypothetical protein [Amycolatopsis sp. NPDC051903]|uniref:hypothetical protein n=1 Tax=Amycolatopsis sp. NPDC051903 TaxID=3363936 RepID=UPI0037889AC8
MSDQPVKQLSEILSGAPTNWGRWGADDEIGALNLLGPEQVLAAAASLRQGRVFTLQTRMADPAGDPFAPHRQRPVRVNVQDQGTWRGGLAPDIPGGGRFADDYLTTTPGPATTSSERKKACGKRAPRRAGPGATPTSATSCSVSSCSARAGWTTRR